MKPSRVTFAALRTGGLPAVIDAVSDANANTIDPMTRERARRLLASGPCAALTGAIDAYIEGTPVPQAQSVAAVRGWSAVFALLAAATTDAAALIAKTPGTDAFKHTLAGRVAVRAFDAPPKAEREEGME
jgi:hypothetical protein